MTVSLPSTRRGADHAADLDDWVGVVVVQGRVEGRAPAGLHEFSEGAGAGGLVSFEEAHFWLGLSWMRKR